MRDMNDELEEILWSNERIREQQEAASDLSNSEIHDAVDDAFRDWASLPHNKKWAKRIAGTPIQNDLKVFISRRIRKRIDLRL